MTGQLITNLPAPRTSLIGREDDLAKVCNLVLHGSERLVTLTGVGGCGKTRLALQVSWELQVSFPGGLYLVEFAPLSNPLFVPKAIASALGIQDVQDREILGALISSLRARPLLLVLDNCEHLIDACATLADLLLSSCPDLRILATSREPLQIPGERQYRVPPLAVPEAGKAVSLDELVSYPALQLFVERATAVQPGFRLTAENCGTIARICTLLAGIPLALELAAARVRVLSVSQIAQRLDDCFQLLAGTSRTAPTRQQTLRATLDWSYNLLSPQEQRLFRHLALFTGDWSLEGAEAVCGGSELERADVLDTLTRLVDRSLVFADERAGQIRYHLLEPVRQYGIRVLEESGEAQAVRDRLEAFYVALAEQAEPEMFGPSQAQWLRRLDLELDNIRGVLGRLEQGGNVANAMRLAGSLHWYFWMHRHLREGLFWLESALAQGANAPPEARAKALSGAAVVCSFLGEYPRGLAYGREALGIHRRLGYADGQIWNGITLSHILLDQEELPEARALGEEAVRLARGSRSHWLLGHALTVLGEVVRRQGDTSQSSALYREAMDSFEEHGDKWGMGMVTYSLAAAGQGKGDFKLPAAVSTIHLHWEQGDNIALADALEYLAGRGSFGQTETRVSLFAAAQSLRDSVGALPPLGEREDVERHLTSARVELGEARFSAAWSAGYTLSPDRVVAGVLSGEFTSPGPAPQPAVQRSRAPKHPDSLTRRETEVARLVALGYTDRGIAEALTITEGTAGVHVHHILEKLRLRSRVQVAGWALTQGLVEAPPD